MEERLLKFCSFYVSDWHLATMLLPYVKDVIKKGEHIKTLLEKNILQNMEEILTRINLDETQKSKIIRIGWKSTEVFGYDEIEQFMKAAVEGVNDLTILVEGRAERIESINESIDKWAKQSMQDIDDKNIKIVNCYEVGEFNKSIKEILDKHDKILNTSGIHEISEMYSGYVKKMA